MHEIQNDARRRAAQLEQQFDKAVRVAKFAFGIFALSVVAGIEYNVNSALSQAQAPYSTSETTTNTPTLTPSSTSTP